MQLVSFSKILRLSFSRIGQVLWTRNLHRWIDSGCVCVDLLELVSRSDSIINDALRVAEDLHVRSMREERLRMRVLYRLVTTTILHSI